MRLAIIATHPIQYYAPVFKMLYQRKQLEVKVFYTWGEKVTAKYDPGFKQIIAWDIPLLDDYLYEWVENASEDPGTHHFKGILNPGVIKQIEFWRPDALLIYGWAFHSHLKILRYFKNKIPVFFRGDSTLLDEKKGIKTVLRSVFLKWIYKHVDQVLYVGANNKAYFEKYGLKDSQLNFTPHSIDNKRFAIERKPEAEALRRNFGIENDEIVVLFAGKLEEKKAPELLLDAFLCLNMKNVHLLFVGNGLLEKELKLKANDISNIHFMDFQNQSVMPVVYQVCDLFCLPSQGPGETWGLAINEAMACGKAILVSDKVGGAIDLIKPGYNGAIFKSGSLDDLIKNLNNLIIGKKKELEEMGRHSKELIKNWDIENQVKAIEFIIKSYFLNRHER